MKMIMEMSKTEIKESEALIKVLGISEYKDNIDGGYYTIESAKSDGGDYTSTFTMKDDAFVDILKGAMKIYPLVKPVIGLFSAMKDIAKTVISEVKTLSKEFEEKYAVRKYGMFSLETSVVAYATVNGRVKKFTQYYNKYLPNSADKIAFDGVQNLIKYVSVTETESYEEAISLAVCFGQEKGLVDIYSPKLEAEIVDA